ncbi:ATPase [Aquicoccus porphyridii]|uniref:ATPase n=1 Tax=Aquicoccus porphyridii TaxID=1852029 RepID=A0A5A9ZTZ6_9RHOB|nr:SRPBCC family protein [Aquicoccus porphyridii]KAA0920629.1 ATPase [Aquicoccus porphyridii]RAI56815.1 ATPase [Rhodobacteraceae bacterium AsT-22]
MTDQTTNTVSEWASWPLDREIVIARVVDADCETAFEAWTDPAQIVQWFGPDGFLIESYEADIRAGGVWRFDMVAPDGTRFSNRMDFLRVEAPHLIELDHGQDVDNDPDRFRLLVTFDEQDNGKTVVTLRQMHPTPERRATVIGFGAVEFGAQTLGKLADHVADKAKVAATHG